MRHATDRQPRNLAARMGGWSARHRRLAISGWLLFVIGMLAIGASVGLKTIDESTGSVGQSQRADAILRSGGFPLNQNDTIEAILSDGASIEAIDWKVLRRTKRKKEIRYCYIVSLYKRVLFDPIRRSSMIILL